MYSCMPNRSDPKKPQGSLKGTCQSPGPAPSGELASVGGGAGPVSVQGTHPSACRSRRWPKWHCCRRR